MTMRLLSSGLGKLSGWAEQSEVIVESVTKMSTTQKYAASKKLHNSDATKITATGTGLQKATANKEATFTVDTTRAGNNNIIGAQILTTHTPNICVILGTGRQIMDSFIRSLRILYSSPSGTTQKCSQPSAAE